MFGVGSYGRWTQGVEHNTNSSLCQEEKGCGCEEQCKSRYHNVQTRTDLMPVSPFSCLLLVFVAVTMGFQWSGGHAYGVQIIDYH